MGVWHVDGSVSTRGLDSTIYRSYIRVVLKSLVGQPCNRYVQVRPRTCIFINVVFALIWLLFWLNSGGAKWFTDSWLLCLHMLMIRTSFLMIFFFKKIFQYFNWLFIAWILQGHYLSKEYMTLVEDLHNKIKKSCFVLFLNKKEIINTLYMCRAILYYIWWNTDCSNIKWK